MADYQLQSSKFHKEFDINEAGVLEPVGGHKLYGESLLRVVVENVTPNNSVIVEGKLAGESRWGTVATVNGPGPIEVSLVGYDFIRFNVLVRSPSTSICPRLIASAFFNACDDYTRLSNTLDATNELLKEMVCGQIKMLNKMDELLLHMEIITEENLSEDV